MAESLQHTRHLFQSASQEERAVQGGVVTDQSPNLALAIQRVLSSGMSQFGDPLLNPALTQLEKRWHLFASTSRAAKIAALKLIPEGTVEKLKSAL